MSINAEQWTQMRGDVKSWWGVIPDSDLDRIASRKDQMVRWLQAKYGYDLKAGSLHLLALINDVLDISKAEAGRSTMAPNRKSRGVPRKRAAKERT